MALLSRVKVLTILILTLSVLVVTRATALAAPQTSCMQSFVPSPNVGSANALFGVSAIASGDVWAVGEFSSVSAGQTLVEHWDGVSWSVVSSPNVGSGSNFLNAVAAVSSNDVWAVGGFGTAGGSQTLVEHWDGVSWSVVSSPSPGSSFNVLDGVTAVSSNDVWAVGNFQNMGATQTLVEHWDGVSWSVVSSPSPGSSSNELHGVTAVKSNDVWAVGILSNTGGSSQTLIEHWNGLSWSLVPGVNFGSQLTELFGVTSTAHSNVWAVGDFQNTGANQLVEPLIEHWNGTSWSVVPNPAANNPGFGGDLHGVAAVTRANAWTAGEFFNNPITVDQTLTEHWTPGTGWHVLNNPPIGTNFSMLRAVTALKVKGGPAIAWAVGFFVDNAVPSRTLTELIAC